MEFGGCLVDAFLLTPAAELAATGADRDAAAAWMARRGNVRALLSRCEGVLTGARTVLPDFQQRPGLRPSPFKTAASMQRPCVPAWPAWLRKRSCLPQRRQRDSRCRHPIVRC